MINHSTQMSLFGMRLQEFKDTKKTSAVKQCNQFLYRHNTAHTCKYLVDPSDIKYSHGNISTVLLTYVPIRNTAKNRKCYLSKQNN